jgi:serine/threonine-protein kinase
VHSITASDEVLQLQNEKYKLIEERDTLRQQLSLFHQRETENRSPELQKNIEHKSTGKKGSFQFIYFILFAALMGAATYWYYNKKREPVITGTANKIPPSVTKKTISQYKVLVPRAFFYDQPDVSTKRSAYMVPSNNILTAFDDKNGFIYTEFTNSKGQTSKGWLKKTDLLTPDQWNTSQPDLNTEFPKDDINAQLSNARKLMNARKYKQALSIYNILAEQKVPEALYEYGNLGLQNKNENIDCVQAYNLIEEASNLGYIPAKRTLGFLYLFADNQDILEINNYENCSYKRDVFKGTKLLTESMLAGDTSAKRLLDELNIRQTFISNDTLR